MKEKTFEELIADNFRGHLIEPSKTMKQNIKILMQQVREATIAEVLKLADENFFNKEPKGKLMANIEEMKTDRITIKE